MREKKLSPIVKEEKARRPKTDIGGMRQLMGWGKGIFQDRFDFPGVLYDKSTSREFSAWPQPSEICHVELSVNQLYLWTLTFEFYVRFLFVNVLLLMFCFRHWKMETLLTDLRPYKGRCTSALPRHQSLPLHIRAKCARHFCDSLRSERALDRACSPRLHKVSVCSTEDVLKQEPEWWWAFPLLPASWCLFLLHTSVF